jgi:Cysteine-rich secretory protein family
MALPAQKSPKSGLFVFDQIETTAAQSGMNRRGQSGNSFLITSFLITGFARCRFQRGSFARWRAALALALFAFAFPLAAKAASPAEMISSFRHQHGEGKVTTDPALNRIAQEQAGAMAARDRMDHAVAKPFADRVANLNAERAAENLAQGDATFAKALDQWIGSYGHRSNLLMHEGTRVGIASARSKSGEIYWAMVIAGPEPERRGSAKGAKGKEKPCRLMLNDTCL